MNNKKKDVTKEQIINDLRKIGVKKGDHISIALSFKSIGQVVGGAEALIDALVEAVGPDGTVIMNTHSKCHHLKKIKSKNHTKYYDPEKSPVTTGYIPEVFRKRKNAIRSLDPVYSVAAIGKKAEYLTKISDTSPSPFDHYSKLGEIGGKMLFIGIGDKLVSIRHQAQYLSGITDYVPPRYGAKYKDENGNIQIYICKNVAGCVKALDQITPILRRRGIIKDVKVGNADTVIAPAKETLEEMTKILIKNPSYTLCDNISCLFCRELERRMRLYGKIKNPKLFQRSKPLIFLIALINFFRFRDIEIANKMMYGVRKYFYEKHEDIFSKSRSERAG